MSGVSAATKLPTFCDLPIPPVPPGAAFSEEQSVRWSELWSSAVAWLWGDPETGLVAAYVHLEAQLFNGSGTAATIREVKSLADSLGLSPQSRTRMNVTIGDDE
jgi:hypothetical protein